jgi:hypothetical protein
MNQSQQTQPLRAVILDNDETTGSYGILFAILEHLRPLSAELDVPFVQRFLKRLAYWMMTHSCFRPGLRKLLTVCMALRNTGALDAIIMYTNQSEVTPPEGAVEFLYSPPKCIQYMFSYLMTHQVFDHLLTRPQVGQTLVGGWKVKQFKRVLDVYPERPLSTYGLLFLDDMAVPPYIQTSGIPKQGVFQSSYFRVTPYKRVLSAKEVFECLIYVFGSDYMTAEFMDDVYATYHNTFRPDVSTTPNGYMMILASEQIQKKYGIVSQKSQPMFLQKKHLNPSPQQEEEYDGIREPSETGEGASE